MHYYQFNIGDYASHTNHLTPLEDIAYRRLIDWCYLHEQPLPKDLKKIAKILRMREECTCIADVLHEFFEERESGYHHVRIEKEIETYKKLVNKKKKAAKTRWANSGKASRGDAHALQVECESNANHKPITINHKPIKQDTSKPSVPSCPHLEIVNLYNEKLPELRSVLPERWEGSARAKDLQARWREDARHQDIEFWNALFTKLRESDWHMGRVNGWSADLGWIVKRSNFDKLVERFFA